MSAPQPLLNGLVLGESPRWHDNRLWFADWGTGEIVATDRAGKREVILNVASFPFSFDFLPTGHMLVVHPKDRVLLRRAPDGARDVHADLGAHADTRWHKLVVDGRGRAFVNGSDLIALVTPDGSLRTVATGLRSPNGMAVTPDNATLIVAERSARRLSAFEIADDGTLHNRRVWAPVDGKPAGICLDADGAVWAAVGRRCVRVREGGAVLDALVLDAECFACTLGGADNDTLFMLTTHWLGRERVDSMGRAGKVFTASTDSLRLARVDAVRCAA
jgi:sugar lactone lactonase YvrE